MVWSLSVGRRGDWLPYILRMSVFICGLVFFPPDTTLVCELRMLHFLVIFNCFDQKRESACTSHARIQKVLSEGVQLWQRFFFSPKIQMPLIGQPEKRHLNGGLLAGLWWPNMKCWLGSFVIFHGIRIRIAKKPYSFVIFRSGGSVPPAPLSGFAHASCHTKQKCGEWGRMWE